METTILACDCVNDEQDDLNGDGLREHKLTKTTVGYKIARCLTCNKEKQLGLPEPKKDKGVFSGSSPTTTGNGG